jgi:hypothetical protein
MVKLQLAVRDGDSFELWETVQRDLAAERDITVARPDGKTPRGTLGLTGAELTVDVATLAAIAKLARFLYDWVGARAKTKVELRDNKSGVSVVLSREMTHEEALNACSALYSAAQRARSDDSRSLPAP